MPSSAKTSLRTSPVEDASATMRLRSPKRVLSWWWSTLSTRGARERAASSPIRSSFAQSTASSTRSAASAGGPRTSSASGMKAYSRGSGVCPARYMTASLPNCLRASVAARSDPRASPSGFSCVTRRKRSCRRSASAIAFRSVVWFIVVRRELVDQAGHAHAALDRRIVLEGQLRSSLQPELSRESRLEDTVSSLEAVQARTQPAARAEHTHVDGGVPQVGGRVDAGDSDQADAGILELRERLREDLPDRLVHPTHALAHGLYSSACLHGLPPAEPPVDTGATPIDRTPTQGWGCRPSALGDDATRQWLANLCRPIANHRLSRKPSRGLVAQGPSQRITSRMSGRSSGSAPISYAARSAASAASAAGSSRA